MRRLITGLALAVTASLFVVPAQGAELVIEWLEPGRYTDIEVGEGNQKRFTQRVKEELTAEFERGAQRYLPDDYTLDVTVTNVDLAGDVEYFFGGTAQDVRVVRDLYFPRLTFAYELNNEIGEAVAKGEVEAEDRTFYYADVDFSTLDNREPFFYERKLIEAWFSKTFGEEKIPN